MTNLHYKNALFTMLQLAQSTIGNIEIIRSNNEL